MGVRCSLLGHEYDEPTEEEDREERGNEVVVTIRELKECQRCGTESVVSETTEVRSIDRPADDGAGEVEAEAAEDADDDPDSADGDGLEPAPSAAEDDGVILDDDEDAPDTDQWPDDHEPVEAEASGDDEAVEPADDADLDRNGETGATDLAEWPDPGVEDEGFDAEPGAGGDVDVEFGGGLQPEAAEGDAGEGTEYVSASGTGITSTGPVERTDDLDTVLVCPECEFAAEAVATSQRPGDICPDCRRGYLTERER